MGVEVQLFEFGVPRPYSFKFFFVGTDEKRSLQGKGNTRDEMVACIMNSAALLKQGDQDDLRRATRAIFERVESALKSMVGFLNTSFELLQFIEIIYIANKCNQ